VIDAEIEGRRSSSRARSWIQRRSYFDREFATALILFEQAAAADPEDVVPTFFAERSARYLKAPPPADWQGFEKLTSK